MTGAAAVAIALPRQRTRKNPLRLLDSRRAEAVRTGIEPEDWRLRARAFSEETLLPAAAEIDRSDTIPDPVHRRLRADGFMGVALPTAWGGQGGGALDLVAVLEEIAAASAAVATLLAVHLSVAAMPIDRWGTESQRERFLRPLAEGRFLGAFALTEPGAGSDAGSLRCRYRVADGEYVLDGSKMFITNAASADVTLLFGTRDPAEGHRGITAFLLPKGTPGFSIAQHLDKLGLRGSETTELVLAGARLPEECRLGPIGEGLHVALSALTGGRVGIAACALGVARAAFEEMRRNARDSPEDWKRSQVARSYTELAAARALVDAAARAKDAGLPFEEAASTAKLFASVAAVQIANRGFDLAGPEAARVDSRAGRLVRDARVFPIVEGTTEIQELILGRNLLSP